MRSDMVVKKLLEVFGKGKVFVLKGGRRYNVIYHVTCSLDKVFVMSRIFSSRYGIGKGPLEWELRIVDQSDNWDDWPIFLEIGLRRGKGDNSYRIYKSKKNLVGLIETYTNEKSAFQVGIRKNCKKIERVIYEDMVRKMIRELGSKSGAELLTSNDLLEREVGKFLTERLE